MNHSRINFQIKAQTLPGPQELLNWPPGSQSLEVRRGLTPASLILASKQFLIDMTGSLAAFGPVFKGVVLDRSEYQ